MLVSSNLPAHIPRAILKCSAVSREINFSSAEEITQFRLEQRIFLDGSCIEGVYASEAVAHSAHFAEPHSIFVFVQEWLFSFGFVIPGSTNSWQQTIESAGPDNMLDPEVMRCGVELVWVL
jgi:retinal rod rhodopsin-sensitive cGMP 3',5'-cyclic phosphodiesterase subunit delta